MREVASVTDHLRYAYITGTYCHIDTGTQIDFGGLFGDHSVNGKFLPIHFGDDGAIIGTLAMSDIMRGYSFDPASLKLSPIKSRKCPAQSNLAKLRMNLCNSSGEILLTLRNSHSGLEVIPNLRECAQTNICYDIISAGLLFHVTAPHDGHPVITQENGEPLSQCKTTSFRNST